MAEPKRKMDPVEHTDYPSLDLGHASSSRTDVSIMGLELQVWGLEEIEQSKRPLGVMVKGYIYKASLPPVMLIPQIATHGRCNSAKNMYYFANGVLGHLRAGDRKSRWEERSRDLIVVTLDQRNHGTRLMDKTANLAFDENPRHLYDMAACVVGGCQDASLVIDFLAAYLFPHGEKVIDQWIATGISLGGNVTWRLMREEPRINTFIPLLGLPFESFMPYLRARAENLNMPWGPPLYPPSLQAFFETPTPAGTYEGKKVLSIHGAADKLVPYAIGSENIERIAKEVKSKSGGKMEVVLMPGLGHVVVPEMVERTAEWVWTCVLQQ